jgi:hypothetical protein
LTLEEATVQVPARSTVQTERILEEMTFASVWTTITEWAGESAVKTITHEWLPFFFGFRAFLANAKHAGVVVGAGPERLLATLSAEVFWTEACE